MTWFLVLLVIRAWCWPRYLRRCMFRAWLIIILTSSTHIGMGRHVRPILFIMVRDSLLRLSFPGLLGRLCVAQIRFIGPEGIFKIFLLWVEVWFWILPFRTPLKIALSFPLIALLPLVPRGALFITGAPVSVTVPSGVFLLRIGRASGLFNFTDVLLQGICNFSLMRLPLIGITRPLVLDFLLGSMSWLGSRVPLPLSLVLLLLLVSCLVLSERRRLVNLIGSSSPLNFIWS